MEVTGERRGWRIAGWSIAGALLLAPGVAMQFTREMAWDAGDFALFAMMLAAAGGICELAVRASGSLAYRAAVAIAVVASFLLLWINLAVGIVGSEDAPVNLLFFGVLAVGVVGAAAARGRALGMAWAMIAMAAAQVGVLGVVVAADLDAPWVFTAVDGAIWLGCAWLFARAARSHG